MPASSRFTRGRAFFGAYNAKPKALTAATYTVVGSDNEGILLLDRAAGVTVTLPAATGSGRRYRFVQKTVPTTNSNIIKVANAADSMVGYAVTENDTDTSTSTFFAAANDDTITFNRTTTGGTKQGEYIEVVDIAANLWFVVVVNAGTGTEATPFSATVS